MNDIEKEVVINRKEKSFLAIRVSMNVAFIGSILVPVLETIRRYHQMSDLHYFISWFDDYLIGGFLFFAAWKTLKSPFNGQRFLIAAWGFATGMIFGSFFIQLQAIHQPDPAPVSSGTVVVIKGIMFITCIVNLILALIIIKKNNLENERTN
jgi:hypothetical protein